MAVLDQLYDVAALSALVAVATDELLGVLTYQRQRGYRRDVELGRCGVLSPWAPLLR